MTTLSLDSLHSQGAFTGAPVYKQVTWTNDDGQECTFDVYVRRLSYHSAVSDVQAASGKGDGLAGRIAACICDKHGKPVFKPDDITGEADPERGALHPDLTLALLEAIGEVNGLGKRKSSAKSKKSGTNLSSPASADAPSPTPSSA